MGRKTSGDGSMEWLKYTEWEIWRLWSGILPQFPRRHHWAAGNGAPPSNEQTNKQQNSVAWVRERTRPTERPRLSAKLVPSVTDSYGRILGFLDRSRYFSFQVAPQLYSRGWVYPVPDALLLRRSDSAGNRTRTSGSVARNCVQNIIYTLQLSCLVWVTECFDLVHTASGGKMEHTWKTPFEISWQRFDVQ
jgi:hypothetical protein